MTERMPGRWRVTSPDDGGRSRITRGEPWPCGCVFLFDDSKVIINDVDMSHMVASMRDIDRCDKHAREFRAAVAKMASDIDAMALAEFYKQALQERG